MTDKVVPFENLSIVGAEGLKLVKGEGEDKKKIFVKPSNPEAEKEYKFKIRATYDSRTADS